MSKELVEGTAMVIGSLSFLVLLGKSDSRLSSSENGCLNEVALTFTWSGSQGSRVLVQSV
jgi:hypothetical protein